MRRNNLLKKYIPFFLILYFMTTTVYAVPILAKSKNVLIINSYNENFIWTKDVVKGITSIFQESTNEYNIYIDNMDLKNRSDEEYIKCFYNLQKNKYRNINFDIIICSDNGALDYLLKYRDSLFKRIPVVFCGVNYSYSPLVNKNNLYTGITENIFAEDTLDTIAKFHTKLETLNVFVGNTATGNITKNSIIKAYSNKKYTFVCNYYIDCNIEKVKEIITSSDNNTAILFAADPIRDSVGGAKYLRTVNDDFLKNSKIPLYSFWDFDLNYGTMGGKLISGFAQGESAAKIAIGILEGNPINEINDLEITHKYIFDYNKLLEFKIPKSILPKDSIIINEPFSFYKTYKSLVISVSIIILLLLIITIVLWISIKEKSRSAKKLNSSYEELSAVHEELTATEEELRAQLEELRDAQEQIEHIAYYDVLTDLPNRRLFLDKAKVIMADKKDFAVLFLDLDEFKKINDTLGHQYGDELLVTISKKLKTLLSDNIIISRFGGDEFAILLSNIKGYNEIEDFVISIMNLFKEPFIIKNSINYVTASVGISVFPYDGKDIDVLLKNVDTAMYKAKESGKDYYCFFNQMMSDEVLKTTIIEKELRSAIKNNELLIYYQPQIDIKTGHVNGIEALIRWNNPKLGFVYPSDFIPIAEKTGLIIPIGIWIFINVCNQIKVWKIKNYNFGSVAINVSPIQVKQKSFLDIFTDIINSLDFSAEYIELEITENLFMDNLDENIEKLQFLKDLGIKIALDDFGTGFSSLNYLRKLPIDKVKIDKSFIDAICSDSKYKFITSEIIKLSHSLGHKVIAEGVENFEQEKTLKEIDCDYAQGYYYSKPIPPNELENILQKI